MCLDLAAVTIVYAAFTYYIFDATNKIQNKLLKLKK
jgi:hypothetical protein